MNAKEIPPLRALPLKVDNLPTFLKGMDHWVCWRGEWKDQAGAYSKMPRRPISGEYLGQEQCRDSLENAIAFYERGPAYAHGIGFSLGEKNDEEIIFIDLDGALKQTERPDGQIDLSLEMWAKAIIDKFPPCYREISPSGGGVHLIVRGKLPRAVKAVDNHTGFEIYGNSRYLAMTGWLMPDSCDDVPFAQDAIDAMVATALPVSESGQIEYNTPSSGHVPAVFETDDDYRWISDVMTQGYLDAEVDGYDSWLRVGMALHSKFGQAGVDLWDQWSRRSAKYQDGECHKKAKGFSAGGPVKFASVVKLAINAGAEPVRRSRSRSSVKLKAEVVGTKEKKAEKGYKEKVGNSCIPEDEYTDLRFADTVIDKFGDKFRYVEPWKEWATWDADKGVWVRSNVRHHELFKMFAVGDDEYLGTAAKIKAAASLAMSDRRILASPEIFDSQADYINLRNGVLDLSNFELINHDPAFMAIRQANVDYDPKATCPRFLKTLEQVQPDQRIRDFLQRWLGTILTGKTLAESVVNYGDGANGKSTILEAVGLVMGTYFAKMPRGFIAKTKHERHPAELVTLYGARFALASETDISDALDEAKIKMILGDGSITARGMHENFWSFTPSHKFAIAANHMPSIVGQDSGIWRRLAFVPWLVTIPEEQRQPEFEKVLFAEEASGILNWLIEGLRNYQKQGLCVPDQIKLASKQVQASSDWLGEFFAETLTSKPRPGFADPDRIRASQVYELYKKWAAANGSAVLPSSKAVPLFTRKVEEMGLTSAKPQNVRWFIGLRPKDESDHQLEADSLVESPAPPANEDDDPPPF